MSKPSWDNAPPWANFLAMDANRNCHWYEAVPRWHPRWGEWTAYRGQIAFAGTGWYPGVSADMAIEGTPTLDNSENIA